MTKEEAKLVLDNARPQTKEIDRQFYDDEDLNNALNMAIKTLEQQPCDDCVSRADARHLIAESFRKNLLGITFNKMFETLYKGIDELPPVTPTQRWIPVNERLPENEEDVLLSVNGDVLKGYFKFDETCYDFGFEDLDETGWYNEHDEFLYNQDIDAWQPLPKPYEEKRGNSDGRN